MIPFSPADDALILSSAQADGSKVVYSRLHTFQRVDTDSPSFSIKFVLQGVEQYRVNQCTHSVKSGEFLLVNQSQSLEVEFASQQAVLGLCLYLNEQIINDVHRNLTGSDAWLLDNPFATTGRTFDFHQAVYSIHGDPLGGFLQQLAQRTDLQTGNIAIDQQGLYYQTAERLLRSQQHVLRSINQITGQQRATREELYRRVCVARRLMDSDVQANWSVGQLAAQAALSEFHFYRSFKQAFGVSPHQYLFQRRLQKATDLLKTKCCTISEIAYLTGFADVFAFSKAFKKTYQVAPSAIL